jgi:hypothetical protein
MARQRRYKNRIYSSISDDCLAILLAKDYERMPSEFSRSETSDIVNSNEFIQQTAARGIGPMMKY